MKQLKALTVLNYSWGPDIIKLDVGPLLLYNPDGQVIL
jgi:hypothetical protein